MQPKFAETDVLIVGSEGAGARAAIEVCEFNKDIRVLVTTKGRIARSGATLTAGTDINLDSTSLREIFGFEGDRRDTKETFFEDVVKEGEYVNDQEFVEVFVDHAPQAVKEVADWGMKITGFWRAAGHRFPRGILSTGVSVMQALKNKMKEYNDRIVLHEDTMVTDLIQDDQGCVSGAVALDLRTGTPVVYKARAVILATGGGLRVYPWTSGPEELTGDGHAMAFRLGAEFVDMEFVQFITCTLINPPSRVKSVNPLLNIGGWLLNQEGQRFMVKRDPVRMEQTTRDNIAIGIMTEIIEGRGFEDDKGGFVLLSLKHLPDEIIDLNKAFNTWATPDFVQRIKGKATKVFPACHFYCGGLKINKDFTTNIPGLFGAGEVCGGLHGSNRLSGNAVTEILVHGHLVGKKASEFAWDRDNPTLNSSNYDHLVKKIVKPYNKKGGTSPVELRKKIQRLAGTCVGVVRDKEMLAEALQELKAIKGEVAEVGVTNQERVFNKEWIEALQVENMAQTLEMITSAALVREESRGTHYRRDFTESDNKNWLKNIVVKKSNGGIDTKVIPAVITKINIRKEESNE